MTDNNGNNKELTPKQKIFLHEYLIDFNATRAYAKAYNREKDETSRQNGYQLLTNTYIKEQIKNELDERCSKLGITEDWILSNLKKVAVRCLTEQKAVTYYDKKLKVMVETGNYTFDSSGANRSLELLGKYRAMWKEYQKIELEESSNPLLDKLEGINKNENTDISADNTNN